MCVCVCAFHPYVNGTWGFFDNRVKNFAGYVGNIHSHLFVRLSWKRIPSFALVGFAFERLSQRFVDDDDCGDGGVGATAAALVVAKSCVCECVCWSDGSHFFILWHNGIYCTIYQNDSANCK